MKISGRGLIHGRPTISASYFSKINFNVILPSSTKSPEWSLPFRIANQNVRISPHARLKGT
jgi:hypothetical protein